MTLSKTNKDIDDCVNELNTLFEYQINNDSCNLNENIVKIKPIIKLKVDLSGAVDYCYRVLKEVVKRYRIADKNNMDFIMFDTKRLCLLLFKPYFRNSYWIAKECHEYEKKSEDYKFEHGIINNDPPDDIYNSIIVYLKDFIINLAI